ncbi:hypothetical protein [Zavarzinia sp. CC-PAN008]
MVKADAMGDTTTLGRGSAVPGRRAILFSALMTNAAIWLLIVNALGIVR